MDSLGWRTLPVPIGPQNWQVTPVRVASLLVDLHKQNFSLIDQVTALATRVTCYQR